MFGPMCVAEHSMLTAPYQMLQDCILLIGWYLLDPSPYLSQCYRPQGREGRCLWRAHFSKGNIERASFECPPAVSVMFPAIRRNASFSMDGCVQGRRLDASLKCPRSHYGRKLNDNSYLFSLEEAQNSGPVSATLLP
jgi:hypothetical protein